MRIAAPLVVVTLGLGASSCQWTSAPGTANRDALEEQVNDVDDLAERIDGLQERAQALRDLADARGVDEPRLEELDGRIDALHRRHDEIEDRGATVQIHESLERREAWVLFRGELERAEELAAALAQKLGR